MSFTTIFALIPTKDKIWAGVFILAAIVGLHLHHKILDEGIAKQKAADNVQSVKIEKQTAEKTADLQARATLAEQAYDKEHQSILDQPSLPAVRLCGNAHHSNSVVSKTAAEKPGDALPGGPAGDIQQVPSGDSSSGADEHPDISGLLSLLAQRADEYNAELREYEDRANE